MRKVIRQRFTHSGENRRTQSRESFEILLKVCLCVTKIQSTYLIIHEKSYKHDMASSKYISVFFFCAHTHLSDSFCHFTAEQVRKIFKGNVNSHYLSGGHVKIRKPLKRKKTCHCRVQMDVLEIFFTRVLFFLIIAFLKCT